MRPWDELVWEILKVPVFVGRVLFILIRNLDLQKGVCCIKEKDSAKAVWITQRPLGYFYDFITIYDFMNLACLEAAQLNAGAFIQ